MTGDMLTFRPTLEEKHILDRNNIRWTEFCRKNIATLNNNVKEDIWDKIVARMILIVLGGLIFALSPLMGDIVLVMLEYMVGTSMVLIGTISTIFLWRNRKRDR